MPGKRVLKWTVDVDDRDHPIGGGKVVAVACQSGPRSVQVWTEEPADAQPLARRARVYGTGHPVPEDDEHVGTALAPHGLVWHVYAGPARPAEPRRTHADC